MNDFMKNIKNNSYFQSLPAWVQENVCQVDISFNSENELREFAEHMTESNGSAK